MARFAGGGRRARALIYRETFNGEAFLVIYLPGHAVLPALGFQPLLSPLMTLSKSNPNDAPARIPLGAAGFFFCWFFLLFFALGQRALNGSEDRWAEIAPQYVAAWRLVAPGHQWRVYFDKPLLSYWLIVLSSFGAERMDDSPSRRAGGAVKAFFAPTKSPRNGLIAQWLGFRPGCC